jgi:hypothetical protein
MEKNHAEVFVSGLKISSHKWDRARAGRETTGKLLDAFLLLKLPKVQLESLKGMLRRLLRICSQRGSSRRKSQLGQK